MINLDSVYLKKGREGGYGLNLEEWEGLLKSNDNLIKDDQLFNESNWRTDMISGDNKIGYIMKGSNYLVVSVFDPSERIKAMSIIKGIAKSTELFMYIRIGGWLEVELTEKLNSELLKINYQLNE